MKRYFVTAIVLLNFIAFSQVGINTIVPLAEFHIAGVPTNLAQLRAILLHPAFRAGDARTSLLSEAGEIAASVPQDSSAALCI